MGYHLYVPESLKNDISDIYKTISRLWYQIYGCKGKDGEKDKLGVWG